MENTRVGDFFRNKWVRTILALDVLIVVAIILVFFMKPRNALITLNVVPYDSTIMINGKEYENGTYAFEPGNYNIEISHDNLEPKNLDVSFGSGQDVTIAIFLKGKDDSLDFYTLKENLQHFYDLEDIAASWSNTTYDKDSSAEGFITKIRKALDLYNSVLPIDHQEYKTTDRGQKLTMDITIKKDLDSECKTFLCLKALMALTDDKEFVKSLIKKKGMELEDYEIYYKVF